MKRIFIMLAVAVLIISLVVFRLNAVRKEVASKVQQENLQIDESQVVSNVADAPSNIKPTRNNSFFFPVDRASERVTKKPFGIYINPQNSPVQPERFVGYHTGTDFETFPEEQNAAVPVYAITSGKIVLEKWASGYGGVLVESAEINNNPVTIIYGHLNLAKLNKKTGENLAAGEQIGILGKGYSQETDGERKHLHLGIHRGVGVDIKGYSSVKGGLNNWIDPMGLF